MRRSNCQPRKSLLTRMHLEALEPRRLLATVRVTTDSDVVDFGGAQTIADLPGHDEVVSLREAIIAANNTLGLDQVRFESNFFFQPRTIWLQQGELQVTDSLVLTGPGADRLSISGGFASRVFNLDDGNLFSDLNVAISHVTIMQGSLSGNHEEGAGILNREDLTLTYSTIRNNMTQGYYGHGAGISTRDGQLNLFGCTVANNVAAGGYSYGAGIMTNTHLGTPDATTITNSTISGNQNALGIGGGIFNWDGLLTISNSTMTGNYGRPSAVGGVASWGDVYTRTEVTSSIISGNANQDVGVIGGPVNSFLSQGHNLIGVGSGASAFSYALGDQVNITDPSLLPLALNGGTTPTHALLLTSPAIDRGSNSLGLTHDQRGAPFIRVDAGFPPDIGAYEWQTITSFSRPLLIVDTAIDESDGNYSVGDLSLREAINAANGFVDADSIFFDTAGVFATPQTIELTRGELWIGDATTVLGPGAATLAIDGMGDARVFRIESPQLQAVDISLEGMTITGGRATTNGGHGGGVLAWDNLTLSECIVSHNSANGLGGGIATPFGGNRLTLIRSTVSGNSSSATGGGIYASGPSLEILDSAILGNTATVGGGGLGTDSLEVTVSNSTISQNETPGRGGGILIWSFANQRINNSTVTQNQAPFGQGGGVWVNGSSSQPPLDVGSTIISGNLNSDVDTNYSNSIKSLGYNLIGSGTLAPVFNGLGDMTGVVDPGLQPLARRGGPTPTHALCAGSLARDHGSNPFGLMHDQRGAPHLRQVGPQPDVGAFEAALLGDFNEDGVFDCADVNSLVAVIAAHTHDPAFDLTNDPFVDTLDLDMWLILAGAAPGSPTGGRPFLHGDANLDGVVDGQDFIEWNSNKFTAAPQWCKGDFNADGLVDGQDFIIWNFNKFQSADIWTPPIRDSDRFAPSDGRGDAAHTKRIAHTWVVDLVFAGSSNWHAGDWTIERLRTLASSR